MGAPEVPRNMEDSRPRKEVDFKGGLSGYKFPWRDPDSGSEMVTEKPSQRPRSRENSGRYKTGSELLSPPFQLCAMTPSGALVESVISQDPEILTPMAP